MSKHFLLIAILCLSLTSSALGGQTQTSDKTQIDEHLRMAQQYLAQNQPGLAIPELEKVVTLDPGNAEAQGNLGVLLFFRENYVEAAEHLRAANAIKPDLWKIRALLGLAEGHLGDAVSSRGDLEAVFPNLQEEKVKNQVGEALIENYSGTGELEKAANVAATMLASQPTDTNLQYTAYRLYSDLADKAMLTLAVLAPDSAQMHQVMARELARHGDKIPAIENYRNAVRLNPQLPGVHSEFAQLLYSASDDKSRSEAEGEFKRALELNPNDERAQLMLGVIADKRGDITTAYANDLRALKLQANDADASTELAKVLIQMNQPAKAQELLEQVVQADPSNYLAHYLLGRAYMRQGKTEQAKQQVDLYKKYKSLHDKLQKIFNDMRIESGQKRDHEDESMLP